MKYLNVIFVAAMTLTSSVAVASTGADSEGSSFLLWLFLGFGALIIVFQSVPGLLLLFSMIKGVFSPAEKKETDKV